MVDGSGIGSAIAANKVPGIRAALVLNPEYAYAREIVFPGPLVGLVVVRPDG